MMTVLGNTSHAEMYFRTQVLITNVTVVINQEDLMQESMRCAV